MTKPEFSYEEFGKMDFRVGRVDKVEMPDWSTKLLRLEVDFGEEVGKRVIFSGIRKWYGVADLEGKQFIFLVNMAVKKMGDEQSQGMMIMADTEEKPIIIPLQTEVPNGVVVR